MSNIIEVRGKSTTGAEIFRLNGNTFNGDILDNLFNVEKIGGLISFTLTISRDNIIPMYPGMIFEFYLIDDVFNQDINIFTGYIDQVPTQEGDNPLIEIVGNGFIKKLDERYYTGDFTDVAISTIINALDFSGLDLNESLFSIDAPPQLITASFKNKTNNQIITDLLKIANEKYTTTQYIYGVDENRALYFKPLEDEIENNLFEGYQFQAPSVAFSGEIVNKIETFRATEADSKITEFVATYEDTDSQDSFGERSIKITMSDYLDTASIQRIAESILSRRASPDKIVAIENFYIADPETSEGNLILENDVDVYNWVFKKSATDTFNAVYREGVIDNTKFNRVLPFAFYGLNTKPQLKNTLISEMDSLDNWAISTPSSVVALSNDHVFTGRQAFKWTRSALQSAGDYIELDLPEIVQNPQEVCLRVFFENNPANMTFTFTGRGTSEYTFSIDASNIELAGTWLNFCQNVTTTRVDADEYLVSADGITEENYLVSADGITEENYSVSYNLDSGGAVVGWSLDNIEKVRITLGEGTANPDTIYIDRIDCKNTSWTFSKLALEKAEYRVKRNFILGNIEFGDKVSTITSTLKEKLSKGDTAFDMYAKS